MANEFAIGKGFELELKGGENPETLPNKSGSDVGNSEQLSDKADGKAPPKGKRVTNAEDITFDKEVGLVEDKAERDIADSYVSDIQGDKVSTGKGYEAYNKLVAKGMAVEVDLNPTMNIREAMAGIRDEAGVTLKGVDESIVTKQGLQSRLKEKLGWNYSDTAEGKANAQGLKERNAKRKGDRARARYESGIREGAKPSTPTSTERIPGYDAHAEHFKPKKERIPGFDAHAAGVNASRDARVAEAAAKPAKGGIVAGAKRALGSTAGKVGVGLAGATALGGAGYAGYRALKNRPDTEAKCGSMPMKKKGLDTEEE